MNLSEYGISIPISSSKIHLFHQYIKENFPKKIVPINEKNSIFDLLYSVHDKVFINNLIDNPSEEIIKTFELIDDKKEYNRYDPKEAVRELSVLTRPFLLQTLGTVTACEIALKSNFSYNLGGGFHHAMSFGGRGFCLVNDIVIAAKYLLKKYSLKQIWVIDIDAHKGDGTAELTVNDSSISTFSIHMKNGWPLDEAPLDSNGKLKPWFIPSDLDVAVDAHEDNLYNSKLDRGLDSFIKKFPLADLAIIVDGSDPYEKDGLKSSGGINLTKEQILHRNMIVYEKLKKLKIPQTYVMSGGYGEFSHEVHIQFVDNIKNDLN